MDQTDTIKSVAVFGDIKTKDPRPVSITDRMNTLKDCFEILSTAYFRTHPEGASDADHPHQLGLPKVFWDKFGTMIKEHENKMADMDRNGYTVRLDLRKNGNLIQALRRAGIIPAGFSPLFGNLMSTVAKHLMKEYGAVFAFTQSDEMTLIIPPCTEEQSPMFSGRLLKSTSTMAAFATSTITKLIFMEAFFVFCKKMMMMIGKFLLVYALMLLVLAQVPILELVLLPVLAVVTTSYTPVLMLILAMVVIGYPIVTNIMNALIAFDARVGHWTNTNDEFALLLWRAYDCSVNGLTDASMQKIGKKMSGKNSGEKLLALHKAGLLPLHPHQACGTTIIKSREMLPCTDPRDGSVVIKERAVYKKYNISILEGFKAGAFQISDSGVKYDAEKHKDYHEKLLTAFLNGDVKFC